MDKTDDVGRQVSELYEEFPYPGHGVVSTVVPLLVEESVEKLRARTKAKLRYIDAGCGTGEQTLGVAKTYSDLEAWGIDRNPASLKMARELASKHGINVHFERRDLMQPYDDLGTYDLITSIGVLHSLPDPEHGFRLLRKLAGDNTIFVGMVYGAFGKWDLFRARDALNLLCGEDMARPDRLRILKENKLSVNTGVGHYASTLVSRLRFGPRINPLEAARRVLAGRNAAYQADSYTHVQEEIYTWGELIALLERTGWKFLGWPKKSGMPDSPEQLFSGKALERMRTLSLPEQAAIYERIVRPTNLYFIASAGPQVV